MADARDGLVTPRARYIMIGGFLGAGKSTSVGRLAQRLTDQGLRVGLITNDQAAGLVDTRTLRSRGFAVEEIAGGCFCCRFDSLRSAAEKLDADSRPDVFIAEPVGSCTDLVATVSYPLRRMYGDRFAIAPLSVLVDPVRAGRILGLREGRPFSSKVTYVYLKQIEEAQVLVINKRDLVSDTELQALRRALAERNPNATIFDVAARHDDGLDPWFDHVTRAELGTAATPEIDYALYGEGEALLGWLNATLRLTSSEEIDGNQWMRDFIRGLKVRLMAADAEVAHLKMTLSPDGGLNDLALVNLVGHDFVPELSERLQDPVSSGQLVVNLRAEGAPEDLRAALEAEVAGRPRRDVVDLELEHLECFRPAQPEPTHRMTAGG
ncbi:MAG: GTP-binding protein [Acidobacteriota bacterium]